MTWNVHWDKSALRDLAGMERADASRVADAVSRYAVTGHGDVKRLKGSVHPYRLRVGGWRVLFGLHGPSRTLIVARVLPRSIAYR